MDADFCDPEAWQDLYTDCVCREKQLNTLIKLIGNSAECCTPSVFIYGHTGTGKTHVLNALFRTLQQPYVTVNCVDSNNSKLLFKEILHAAFDRKENVPRTCTSMSDFVRHFQSARTSHEDPFFIIFDKAERLRSMDAYLLPSFLRLSEITAKNVCTIFVSEMPFEKFFISTGMLEPIKIYFPNYSKIELLKILGKDCPSDWSETLYQNYIKVILDVFFGVCRDLNELRYMADMNFDKYVEPLVRGNIGENESRLLWQNIHTHLRDALQRVYMRDIAGQAGQSTKNRAGLELPYYSKYLLIAAFLASYNPANTDNRMFVKKSFGKMTKRGKTAVKDAKKLDKKFLGPKAFPLDRLMAIFYSIVEGGANPSAMILSQISTLVTLNFLAKCSADDQIDAAKYKCLVPLNVVRAIGKQVDFDVAQYLYDL